MKNIVVIIMLVGLGLDANSQTRSGLGVHMGVAKVGLYNDDVNQKNANGLQIGVGYNLKIGPIGFR